MTAPTDPATGTQTRSGSRMRASDADREAVVQRLHEAVGRGQLTLADLGAPAISEALARLKRGDAPSGRPVTEATRNRYLSALSHALTLAWREWGWLLPRHCGRGGYGDAPSTRTELPVARGRAPSVALGVRTGQVAASAAPLLEAAKQPSGVARGRAQ